MNREISSQQRMVRCAIYCRKSTDEGLDAEFTSLDAQRESGENYIASQRHEGWVVIPTRYEDGGISGGTLERPALKRLLADIEAGKVDCVVCYKVDRLSRSLLDFSKLMELFDKHQVTFVSVTQAFSTTNSIGRLTLNILLSFAQFEREVIGERIRDKIAMHKQKGMYTGGHPILGYDIDKERHKLIVNPKEAVLVNEIFTMFIEKRSISAVATELNASGVPRKTYVSKRGKTRPLTIWTKATVRHLLTNRTYIGEVTHKDKVYKGEHEAIISRELWDAARALFKGSPAQRSGRTRQKHVALLRGLMKCGHCGCAMVPTYTRKKDGREYRYYVCMTAVRTTYHNCPIGTVPAGEIEEAVRGYLQQLVSAPEIIASTYRHAVTQEREVIEHMQHEHGLQSQHMKDLRRREQELMNDPTPANLTALQDVIADITQTTAAMQRIADEKRRWEAHRITEADVTLALGRLDAIWPELIPAEQATLVQGIVENITIDGTGLQVNLRADGLHSVVSELGRHMVKEGVRELYV
ncbi:MAG: DNA-invertase hin [bacterium ADurb.Bin429]|nr:MAG: DNA-invertase hin [bacterium ADurb.Bin429]